MAVQQIGSAYQNDGNFSQLDLKDVVNDGPVLRIETFRCSHGADSDYGTTSAGTSVANLAGIDHLKPDSNAVFRHVYSVTKSARQIVTLEMRERFEENGSFEVRVRDVDAASRSYGQTVVCRVVPLPSNRYRLSYELRKPGIRNKYQVLSPLGKMISDTTHLCDIGESDLERLGSVSELTSNPTTVEFNWNGKKSEINTGLSGLSEAFQSSEEHATFRENIVNYLRMGDFRDKCIHDGTNLSGSHQNLASEYVLIRAYRSSLVILGRLADPEMYRHTLGRLSPYVGSAPLATDPKPGVYTPFLNAYIANVEIYQLGLDKVHSDYGGIPMRQAPGSRLEDGTTPVLDASRFNRSIAELAYAFYVTPPRERGKSLDGNPVM